MAADLPGKVQIKIMSEERDGLGVAIPKGNHIATRSNQRALSLEEFRIDLFKNYEKQIKNYLGDKDKAMKFMSAMVYSVQKTPKLLECSKDSIMQSFMSCAEFKLYPSNVAGEAYVLPYNSKNGMQAQFQLGYQGIITLLYRAGIKVTSKIVKERDHFDYEEGLNPTLRHSFDPFGDRGGAKGVYAIAELPDGRKMFKVMSKEEVMKYRGFSKAKDSPYSPWNSDQDPDLMMWQKTAIKQLSKTLPKTEELQTAILKDNEDSIISDRQNALDAGGPAVGRASHAPDEVDIIPNDDDSANELNAELEKEQKAEKKKEKLL